MIDATGDQPEYRRLADRFRGMIIRGELAPGQFLPSEEHLVAGYEVGRDTVRAALALLRSEGLVVTVARLGTYVRGDEEVRIVTVASSARITARMPTDGEHRAHRLPEGRPVLVVAYANGGKDVFPADRTIIEIDGSDV